MAITKEPLSLSYLRGLGVAPAKPAQASGLSTLAPLEFLASTGAKRETVEPMLLLAAAILSKVTSAPEHEMQVYDLVDQLKVPLEAVIQVVAALIDMKVLVKVKEDLKGNHLVKMTSDALSKFPV